ncbi:MAG: aspartyl/asparaginyl beta-hydroxylase domain-containing protein [Solirubrobacteraceae bacterium]
MRSAEFGVHVFEPVERWIGRRSPVGDTPFYDAAQFPWAAELEAHWREIRAELDAVLADRGAIPAFQDISVDQVDLSSDDRWKTYFLFGYGFEVAEHTAACPCTAELVRAIPGMKTAMFSILAPGKHIPHHRGRYKGVLRVLFLDVVRPLTGVARDINTTLLWLIAHSPLISDARRRQERWTATHPPRLRAAPRR